MQKIIEIILLWTARTVGVLLFTFFIWFAFEIGMPVIDDLSNQEWILFISNIFMLAGIIIALRFRLIGSMLTLIFYIVFSVANHSFWVGQIFPFFLMSAILYFISWLFSNYTKLKSSQFNYKILFS